MPTPFDLLFKPQQPMPAVPTPRPMMPQAPASPMAPAAPPAPPGGGGFNPRDLMMLLGAVSAMRGNTGFGQGLMQGEARRQQQEQQQAQLAQEQAFRQQQFDAQQKNIAADNSRADKQAADAQLARRMQFVQSLPAFLGDEGIESPEAFDQRFGIASQLGGELGVESGFLNTFRPTPDKFTQRKAKKVVARIEGDKRFQQALAHPDFQGQIFEEGGEQKTYAEWKALAGQSGPMAGSPAMPTKTQSEAPLDRQALDALERGDKATYDRIMKVKRDMDVATRDPKAPPDPILTQIRELTLANLQRNQGSMPPGQFSMATRLADDYTQQSKDYLTRLSARDSINAAVNDPSAAGDLALIFAYMRMLDPGSTVREGEFANAQNAAGVPDRVRNAYNRAISGERLNPNQRVDFQRQAEAQFQQAQKRQRGLIGVFTERATRAGLNPKDVIIDYDTVFGTSAPPNTNASAPPKKNPFRK